MFNINDIVRYGANGVCEITAKEERELAGTRKSYLVLKSLCGDKATYYVPADNEKLLGKIHRVLSVEEINDLIDSIPRQDEILIEEDKERRECYKKIIAEGNHPDLIRMIKTIWAEKTRRNESGKRLHIADERFLKEAEKRLHGEFQYVLKLSDDELMTYIGERVGKNKNDK